MKKLLFLFIAIMLLGVTTMEAQNTALYIRGGYSWLTGVVGGEIQVDHFGIGGGWMPNKTPLTGDDVNSFGLDATWYSGNYDEESYYYSLGYVINGYQEEYSTGYYESENMAVMMCGYKIVSDMLDMKGGVGLGFVPGGGTVFTFEITLGLNVLGIGNL